MKAIRIVLGVVLVLALAATGVLWYQNMNYKKELASTRQQLSSLQNNPAIKDQVDAQDTINKVSALVNVPTDETPTVATVTDLSQLKNQPFFANAQVGDKVVIYQNAKEAILYRPSNNKIIQIAPLNTSQQTQAQAQAPAAQTQTQAPANSQPAGK
jgi:uncharacterized membrane protein